MADGPNRGPYQQDPFTHIIEIHFPSGEVTKLDFVKNKYKVKGQLQNRDEVIDHPEWRIDASGLDLRGSEDLLAPPRMAKLINKTGGPSATVRGALNEFTFLDYTIVLEFEWYDRKSAYYAAHPEYVPSPETGAMGFNEHDIFFASHEDDEIDRLNTFEMIQSNTPELVDGVNPTTFYGDDFDGWVPYITDPDTGVVETWKREYSYAYEISSVEPGPVPMLDGTGFPIQFFDGPEPPFAFGQPPPWGVSRTTVWEQDPYTAYPVDDAFVAYDRTGDISSDHRIVPTGASLDPDFANRWTGGADLPFGINRVAMTVSAGKIVVSVNHGDPFSITAGSKFTVPRVPADLLAWFETATTPWKFMFNATMHLRCVWLFRTKKPDSALKAMSEVKPLPEANSPKWDKPPGQDQ